MNAVIHASETEYAIGEIAGVYDTQTMCDYLKLNYPTNH
jgi:hypothetical protein